MAADGDAESRPQTKPSSPRKRPSSRERSGEWFPEDPLNFEGIVVRVRFSNGKPAAGASVYLSRWGEDAKYWGPEESEVTDGSGRCKFWWIPEGVAVVAVVRGYLPASIPDFASWYRLHEGEEAILYIDREALGIRGHVLDCQGNRATGWRVSVVDETPLELNESAEELIRFPQPAIVAEELKKTDDQGAFDIWGLLDRDYTIVARSEDGSSYAFAEGIPAGSENVTLRAREDAFRDALRGRVVGWNGTAIVGARVSAHLRTAWNGGGLGGAYAETDEQGRFMLEGVPRFLSSIDVSGEHIIHHEVELDSANLSDEITLVVEREARFRVAVAEDIPLPLHVWGWDSEGSWLSITQYMEDGSEMSGRFEVNERQTPVVWLREAAVRLTFHDQKSVSRDDPPEYEVGISLNPDVDCNVIRVGF